MLPVLQVGPVAIRAPGLVVLASLWVGLELASRAGSRRGLDPDHIYTIGFWSVVVGALAARAGFVLANLTIYLNIQPATNALLSVISPAPGTEIEWAGLLASLAIATLLTARLKVPPLDLVDAFASGLAVMAVGVSIANLLSGQAYGIETSLPWGINLWGERRHPVQIYTALAFVAISVILWRRQRLLSPAGMQAQWFLILSGVTVMLIEPLRADSPTLGAGIRTPQVIALIGVLVGLGGFVLRAPPLTDRAAR
jgi:phosphatidylglycerol---prolipoprotein diacylglyceryl transferase